MKKECECWNNKFLLIIEKLYEWEVLNDWTLNCEADSDNITQIKCLECWKEYFEKDFISINY